MARHSATLVVNIFQWDDGTFSAEDGWNHVLVKHTTYERLLKSLATVTIKKKVLK